MWFLLVYLTSLHVVFCQLGRGDQPLSRNIGEKPYGALKQSEAQAHSVPDLLLASSPNLPLQEAPQVVVYAPFRDNVGSPCWNGVKRQAGQCLHPKNCPMPLLVTIKRHAPATPLYRKWVLSLHQTCQLDTTDAMFLGVCCPLPDAQLTNGQESRPTALHATENETSIWEGNDEVKGSHIPDTDRGEVVSKRGAEGRSLMDRSHVLFSPKEDSMLAQDDPSGSVGDGRTPDSSWHSEFAVYPPPYVTHPPFPTHPPLPTHPPSLTDRPWWTTVRTPTAAQATTTSTAFPSCHPFCTHRPPSKTTPRTTQPPPTTVREPPTATPKGNFDVCSANSVYAIADDSRVCDFRVTKGQRAQPYSFPWLAAIFKGPKQYCGGSLIDSTHILTAAHCVATLSSWEIQQLRVKLGAHNIHAYEGTAIDMKVAKVVRHKDFDFKRLYNDVAILTLERPVKFSRYIRPICLDAVGEQFLNQCATVAGWGSIYEDGPQPGILHEVGLTVISNEDCRAKYGTAAPGGIVPSYICAGHGGRDACTGDSGGPLVRKIGGVWKQIGIVSWGIGCGKMRYPGVYSRISHFLPWIKDVSRVF